MANPVFPDCIPYNTNFLKSVSQAFSDLLDLKLPEGFEPVAPNQLQKQTSKGLTNVVDGLKSKVTKFAKGKKEERDQFVIKVENHLVRIEELRVSGITNTNGKDKGQCTTWPFIFYSRMVASKFLLSEKAVDQLKNIISCYIQILSLEQKQNSPVLKIAAEIWGFLENHSEDPDCSLIGLIPQEEVIIKSTTMRAPSSTASQTNEETSRETLMNKILQWSELKDDKYVADEVRKFAQIIRNDYFNIVKYIKKGELVIVRFPGIDPNPTRYLYGRFEEKQGNSIKLYATPIEDTLMIANIEDVFPLSTDMKEFLKSERQMEKLIKDPANTLFNDLNDTVKEMCMNYLLQERAIPSIDTLERWNKNEVSINELPAVRKSVNKLYQILSNPPNNLYAQVEDIASGKINEFYGRVKKNEVPFFVPTKERSLSDLGHFVATKSVLAKQRFQRYLNVCETALEQLNIQKKEIMNGKTKNELTEWWLGLIRKGIDRLLKIYHYNFSAVPDNYIDTPPTSLQAVRDNLAIVKQLLEAFNANQQRKSTSSEKEKSMQADLFALINDLKAEIYPKIDDFVCKAQVALQDYFDCLDIAFELDIIQSLLKLTQDEMDVKTQNSIDRVVGEILYVQQMKQLEGITAKSQIKDVVPISGLIVGRIYRFENELETVLEHWKHMKEQ